MKHLGIEGILDVVGDADKKRDPADDFKVTFIEDKKFWEKGQKVMTFLKAFQKMRQDLTDSAQFITFQEYSPQRSNEFLFQAQEPFPTASTNAGHTSFFVGGTGINQTFADFLKHAQGLSDEDLNKYSLLLQRIWDESKKLGGAVISDLDVPDGPRYILHIQFRNAGVCFYGIVLILDQKRHAFA